MIHQTEIQFFWPLTEQIPLDLEYGPTHLYYRAQGIAGTHSMPIAGSIYEYKGATGTTVVNPQLTVSAIDSVAQLSIGGINVGLQKKPTWIQSKLFKLLGFNWKEL